MKYLIFFLLVPFLYSQSKYPADKLIMSKNVAISKNSDDGTTFQCTLKECTCSEGDAAVGTDCKKHGEEQCMSCSDADMEFKCGKCVFKICQCGYSDTNCATDHSCKLR